MSQAHADTRTRIIRFFTFIGGLYFFVYFVCSERVIESIGIKAAHESISNGFIAVGAMAIGLGLLNILASHGSRVLFTRKGWLYSLALLLGLLTTLVVSIGQWREVRGVTADIRTVQMIGDFAARIVEDATPHASHADPAPKSVSTSGELPPLSVRVDALRRYTVERLVELRQYIERARLSGERSEAHEALLQELGQIVATVDGGVGAIQGASWEALGESQRVILMGLAQSSAKLSSTYSLLRRKDSATSTIQRMYDLVYNGVFIALGSAMFALLGIYIAAAAYRAFRVRTLEAALMMSAALVVMLGQISFGRLLYEDMPALRQWLLEVPNSAAFRAIRLGAGVAGLMLAIRMWLSIESGNFSNKRRE